MSSQARGDSLFSNLRKRLHARWVGLGVLSPDKAQEHDLDPESGHEVLEYLLEKLEEDARSKEAGKQRERALGYYLTRIKALLLAGARPPSSKRLETTLAAITSQPPYWPAAPTETNLSRLLEIESLTTQQIHQLFEYLRHHQKGETEQCHPASDHDRGRRNARAHVYQALLQHPAADRKLFLRFCQEVLAHARMDGLGGRGPWRRAIQCEPFRDDPIVHAWLIEHAPTKILLSLLEKAETSEMFGQIFEHLTDRDGQKALEAARARAREGDEHFRTQHLTPLLTHDDPDIRQQALKLSAQLDNTSPSPSRSTG